MIAVATYKNAQTGKQMVMSWRFIPKSKMSQLPSIPGEREYIHEKDVPYGFYKDCTVYCLDSGILHAVYPSSANTDPKTMYT